MEQRLEKIKERQHQFQKLVKFPIDTVLEQERNELAEKYIFKMIEEMIELRKEFPSAMNPWSKSQKKADRSRILEELSDVILFFINFMILWKISPEEILDMIEKVQENNYNSVKQKKMDIINTDILKVQGKVSGIGQGNLTPKYVFIGQNPAQGIAKGYKFFSNPEDGSSKVVLPVLEELGILKDCYFTNIVKSTTEDNEQPPGELTDFWSSFFDREIEILKENNPEMQLIFMGNYAAKYAEKRKIDSDIITHPARVLYGNLTIDQFKNEIKKITSNN